MKVAYLDSSALVKLYLSEAGRDEVQALLEATEAVTTSVIAYAEARATFARRLRNGELSDEEHAQVVEDFESDWAGVNELAVTPEIYRLAGNLTVNHPLRGMDALHLASALRAKTEVDIHFLSFDRELQRVADVLI